MRRLAVALLLFVIAAVTAMSAGAVESLAPSLGGVFGDPDGPPKPPADSSAAIQQVQAVLDAFTADIDKLSAGTGVAAMQLKSLGQRIALALFGTILAWGTIRSWVLDRGLQQLLPELVQPLVALGMSLWAVDGFAGPVRDSIVALGDLIANDVDPRIANETGLLQGLGSTALQLLITPISDGFHPFGWLACKLVAILAAAVLMLASVIGAGMIIVAKLQTAIGLLLAPVFIPWAMWQPSMFLFNAWLTFLITGAMTQTMVKIIAALTTSAVNRMSAIVQSYSHHDVSIVAFGALFACALIIAFMFLSAPRLTSALVGGVSVGLEGWVSTAVGITRALANATKAAVGAALQVGRLTGKAMSAAGLTGLSKTPGSAQSGSNGARAAPAKSPPGRSSSGSTAASSPGGRPPGRSPDNHPTASPRTGSTASPGTGTTASPKTDPSGLRGKGAASPRAPPRT